RNAAVQFRAARGGSAGPMDRRFVSLCERSWAATRLGVDNGGMTSHNRRQWPGDELVKLMSILSMDLLEVYEHSQTDPWDQATRRTWVRTFCSQLEAFVYATKQMVASLHGLPFVKLSADDLAFLLESEPAGEGSPKKRRFLPL